MGVSQLVPSRNPGKQAWPSSSHSLEEGHSERLNHAWSPEPRCDSSF